MRDAVPLFSLALSWYRLNRSASKLCVANIESKTHQSHRAARGKVCIPAAASSKIGAKLDSNSPLA